MTIDELEVVPELAATDTEEGLMPCWPVFSCWFVASVFTTIW
jgi:hypothetical protein